MFVCQGNLKNSEKDKNEGLQVVDSIMSYVETIRAGKCYWIVRPDFVSNLILTFHEYKQYRGKFLSKNLKAWETNNYSGTADSVDYNFVFNMEFENGVFEEQYVMVKQNDTIKLHGFHLKRLK